MKTEPATSYAHAEELADAFRVLKAHGKKVVCHFEDAGPKALYACASANKIVPMTLLLTDWPLTSPATAPGIDATIPPKMMIETPLPIPNSVISSPIQTRSNVPAAMAMRVATTVVVFTHEATPALSVVGEILKLGTAPAGRASRQPLHFAASA